MKNSNQNNSKSDKYPKKVKNFSRQHCLSLLRHKFLTLIELINEDWRCIQTCLKRMYCIKWILKVWKFIRPFVKIWQIFNILKYVFNLIKWIF